MKYLTAILISCVTTLVSAQSTKETRYKKGDSLSKKITKHKLIFKYDRVRSVLSCASECSNNELCSFFFPNNNQYFCSLHSKEQIGPEQTTGKKETTNSNLITGASFPTKDYRYNETTGTWYKVYFEKRNWTSAITKCEHDGALLMNSNTQQKRQLVNHICENVPRGLSRFLWIGCRLIYHTWLWTDGTKVDSANWAHNNPHYHKKLCCTQKQLKFYSTECYSKQIFVCEISPK